MILGGSKYIIPLIKKARDLGVYVITCDNLPNNHAHIFSDQYCNVSILDKDAVLAKAEELKIDGISSFACDPGVVTAAYVAEKMGLPSPGPYESIRILQNKGLFRKFLAENGFNVPFAKSYSVIEEAVADAELFNWPVIVKPVDSAGSKGVRKVDKNEQLVSAIKYALSFSHRGEVIIEDYLEQKGFSSDSDSFSIDGKMVYYSFSSQRFDKNAINPFTPSAYSWPSSISSQNIEVLKNEIQRIVTLLKLKTSIYNIETRECASGKAYIMEFSPRGGGNRLAEMVYYYEGVDLITSVIKASLGIKVDLKEKKKKRNNVAEIILHSDYDGVFKELRIDESIKNNIIETDLWVKKGDIVEGFNGANKTIGTLILRFDSQKQLSDVLDNIDNYINVVVKKTKAINDR